MSKNFKELAADIGELVTLKNKAYGNSFERCGEFLKILYPDGIAPENYGDMLCVVRIFDKLMRVATKKGAFAESPWLDLAGYGLLGLHRDEQMKERLEKLMERVSEAETLTEDGGELAPAEQEHISNSPPPASPSLVNPVTGEEFIFAVCHHCQQDLGQPVPKKYIDEGKFFMHTLCHEKLLKAKEEEEAEEAAPPTAQQEKIDPFSVDQQ